MKVLLVGGGGRDKRRAGHEREGVANSAFLFGPEGKMLARYDKMRLLPFNEYVPLRGVVAWPAWLAPNTAEAVPGTSWTLFALGEASFGVLICWENAFPGAARRYAREGVDFMVSITNETFTSSAVAREQLLATNVLRAVETGLAFVRAATTGVSAVIAPDGRIVARVRDADGGDVDVVGYLTAEIPLGAGPTPYTRFGDAFVAAALGIVLIAGPLAPLSRRRSRHP